MDEALEHGGGFFPADAKTAVVLEPANGPFDRPAALITTKSASILSLVFKLTIGAMRGDPFNAATGKPRASTMIMILTPFPALVAPMPSPPPLGFFGSGGSNKSISSASTSASCNIRYT